MFNLKAFRKKVGFSQMDMAKILGCTQAFISQIENFRTEMPSSYFNILNEKFGRVFADFLNENEDVNNYYSDEKDDTIKEVDDIAYDQFVRLIEILKKRTGKSIVDISNAIYRNSTILSNAFYNRRLFNSSMITYISKRLDKVGLTPSDIINDDQIIIEGVEIIIPFHFENTSDFVDFVFKKKASKGKTDLMIRDVNADYFLNNNITLNESLQKNDILALKEVFKSELSYGKVYCIIKNNGDCMTQYLFESNKDNYVRLSYFFPPKNTIEMSKDEIFKIFIVNSVIKITTL